MRWVVADFTLKRQVHVRLSLTDKITGMVVKFEMWVTEGLPRDSGGAPGRLRQLSGRSPDQRPHGNSILTNEQQVFTGSVNLGNT